MTAFFLSRAYHKLLPIIRRLPLQTQIKIAAMGREYFMQKFVSAPKTIPYVPDHKLAIKMWGINFRTPIANAAGMFKNGDGYDMAASIGAGAYIGGTSTANRRFGNKKHGIMTPFIHLPKSGLTINWLGLPNYGDEILSQKILTKNKIWGCPIGWSIMRSPDYYERKGLDKLIEGLWLYHGNLQIDFIEINESCPNIELDNTHIVERLEIISREFLAKRQRHLPVVIKLPHNLNVDILEDLIVHLVRLNYDGVNIGNSSALYGEIRNNLDPRDYAMFDYFTTEFGGGCSGLALKKNTLKLCAHAVKVVHNLSPMHEFHVIRTGGISSHADLEKSRQAGISFNHWYSGFFDSYSRVGDKVYQKLFVNAHPIKH